MKCPKLKHQLHSQYRSDIDGLRAIAVLAVVAFHAFPEWISGGYIGVDIFFVISGYLISIIIFEDLDKKNFSFINFYGRRIRRIFPALLLVLLSCYIFGWLTLLTEEYWQLGKHIAGGASFISNFLLWRESGYFDNSVYTKPLLHLWSLGIEEQFYIIWPALLFIAWKYRINYLRIILFIALTSFLINIITVSSHPNAAFYSPLSRFWELSIGSILAYIAVFKEDLTIRMHKFNNTLSVLGLAFIVCGAIFLTSVSLFPGVWALLPTLGAGCLIISGPHSWISRILLSNRILVWFGLISFPLYLWHWPLLSFAYILEGELSLILRTALITTSIVLAWITYSLIEQPIRRGKHFNFKIISLLLLATIIGFIGFNTYLRDGLSFRKNAQLKTYSGDIGHLDFHKHISDNFYPCIPKSIAEQSLNWSGFVRCAQSHVGPNVDIALIGDSHVEHLFIGMAESLPNKNIAFYIKASPPYVENSEFSNIFEFVLRSKTIKTVILGMYWPDRLGKHLPQGSSEELELLRTAQAFINAGKDVYIVNNVPTFPFGPDKCRGKRWLSTKETTCIMEKSSSEEQLQRYSQILIKINKADSRIRLIDINQYLCNKFECSQIKGRDLMYRDNNHLNINGSRYIGKELINNIQNLSH